MLCDLTILKFGLLYSDYTGGKQMRLQENTLLDAYFVAVCGELRPKCGVSGLEARLLIFFSAASCAVFGCKMGS